MSAELGLADRSLLETSRTATLATIAPDSRPRLVPICFVVVDNVVWTPLDEKTKSVDDVRSLARVRDITRDPRVTVLIDRWSEDWSELAWLRLRGRAHLVEPPDVSREVIAALREKYPQYLRHDLEHRPALRIEVGKVSAWLAASASGGG